MYAFVDRLISEQDRGVQLYVWAMREWVKAAVEGRCVCHVIAGSFGAADVAKAAAPFHVAMRTLCSNARLSLQFGSVDRPSITELEAIMVEGACAAAQGRQRDLRAAAQALVFPDLAPVLAGSLTTVANVFHGADLSLEPAWPNS